MKTSPCFRHNQSRQKPVIDSMPMDLEMRVAQAERGDSDTECGSVRILRRRDGCRGTYEVIFRFV
ncbi:hypothetical protein N7472_006100 [Penicillium cf. griseofulvum]|uniref:Uncharacterized protein n=1 Tax=Penicillium cf. griseofulvum TaxID=2972120 RepID=A0A9W9JAR0_9EURO|nr:hypothetical protein N7472_006100 [Penicillium cf. griseofulvum]